MKVLPFDQSPRPAASGAAPAKETPKPDADPARQRTATPFADEGHPHDEPGYGHGV